MHGRSRFSKKGIIKIGCSSITWGGKDEQAITEMAGLGYNGIQLRVNTFAPYRTKVSQLKNALVKNDLTFTMFSSGNVEIIQPDLKVPWIRMWHMHIS